MGRNALSVALLLVALVMMTANVVGAPIYSQVTPEEPVGAFSSRDTTGGQRVADNFSLEGSEPITVRSIKFLGGYGKTSPPPLTPPLDALPTDGLRVVFFEDDGGIPGTEIVGGDFSIEFVFRRTPTNGRLISGVINPIEFILNLGNGVTLSPNTDYWISITNDLDADHGWLWARSQGLIDSLVASKKGDLSNAPWEIFNNGGMWFELNDQTIPEPNTFCLIASLLGLPLLQRRVSGRS